MVGGWRSSIENTPQVHFGITEDPEGPAVAYDHPFSAPNGNSNILPRLWPDSESRAIRCSFPRRPKVFRQCPLALLIIPSALVQHLREKLPDP